MHGHFYQPPREDPFTHLLPLEVGATPFANFNEKITSECYRPNVEAGNFEVMSYDMGPTLAAWLEQTHPDVYQGMIEADRCHLERYGVGNALAQAYNHTILPLATTRDKRTQILWGLEDFRHRYGHDAHGMWLAETAVDLESLQIMAECGITYTVLAPWQAAQPVDPTEPYILPLSDGRRITVFFYRDPASGEVSFHDGATQDANRFAQEELAKQLNQTKCAEGEDQLIVIATDGELYGHHKRARDRFLSWLLRKSAPAYGFEVISLERYLCLHPARREVQLHVPSAWSCAHGVARWSTGCECTEGDGRWKAHLRQALVHLSEQGDQVFERYAGKTLSNPWAARDEYLAFHHSWGNPECFWTKHGKEGRRPQDIALILQTAALLEAQYYQQYSFTSCGFFFEDLDRIEPRNDIAFARRAISLIWQATGIDLQRDFVEDLKAAKSWRTGRTGADLYRQLPEVPREFLPTTRHGFLKPEEVHQR
jgi:hypothetical protein